MQEMLLVLAEVLSAHIFDLAQLLIILFLQVFAMSLRLGGDIVDKSAELLHFCLQMLP